jgi:hypothetical protein
LVAYYAEGRIRGGKLSRKRSIERGELIIFGVLLVFVFGTLAGCGGSGERGDIPASPEEADEVVVRVSGTEGTAYSGTYENITGEGEPQIIDETLGDEPTEYEVEVEEGASDGVSAFFEKTQPGGGELKAEILADGEVITESKTYAEFGSVIVDWFPQDGALEEIPLEEDSFEESP